MLTDGMAGECQVLGEGTATQATLLSSIPRGHKVGLVDIAEGAPIIKYGVVIGLAAQPIHAGEHVHLHNCRSQYDERSASLRLEDGCPTDTRYE